MTLGTMSGMIMSAIRAKRFTRALISGSGHMNPENIGQFGDDCRGYKKGVGSFESMFPNLPKRSLGTGEDRNIYVGVENSSKLYFLLFFCSHGRSFPRPAA